MNFLHWFAGASNHNLSLRNTYLSTKAKGLTMIQIPDWAIIASILIFFVLCLVYLVYFIISKKLYPQVVEFQKEITPNNSTTILEIEGVGILKKIDVQTTDNNTSLVVLVIDHTAYATLSIGREGRNSGKGGFDGQKDSLLKFELNFDKKFRKNFSIFIENRSDVPINSSGKIFYEIKKPLIK